MALWDHYVDYLIPDVSPKTVNGTYNPVKANIGRCKTDGLIDPLKFPQELLKVTTRSQARRTLMQISTACKLGIHHGLVRENPFEGMYRTLDTTRPPSSLVIFIDPALCPYKTVYATQASPIAIGDKLRWTRNNPRNKHSQRSNLFKPPSKARDLSIINYPL